MVMNATRALLPLAALLLAPLAESAAGWGLCADPKTKQKINVFASTDDPDYQKLLALCRAGKSKLDQIKRFDMPDFEPRSDWVREMTRYGILANGSQRSARIGVYAAERTYWESLWHQTRK